MERRDAHIYKRTYNNLLGLTPSLGSEQLQIKIFWKSGLALLEIGPAEPRLKYNENFWYLCSYSWNASVRIGDNWTKPVVPSTWRRKSRTAGWLQGEQGVSRGMPSSTHSACSCWNSISETYRLRRSLTMFTHSWKEHNTRIITHGLTCKCRQH